MYILVHVVMKRLSSVNAHPQNVGKRDFNK